MESFKKSVDIVVILSLLFPYLFPITTEAQSAFSVQVVGTTNTQAILKYTAPDTSDCKVEVSESASYSPLVHDVNASLFAGANLDNRTGSITSGTTRIVVIGKRNIDLALNGKRYSRALQAYTTHYYKITCGANTSTGTFTTANIPLGNTYSDPVPVNPEDPTKFNAWPSFSLTDRTEQIVDPKTGALIKRVSLGKERQSEPYPYNGKRMSSGGDAELCSRQADAMGFYHCGASVPGGATLMYAIHGDTGEARLLGQLAFYNDGFHGCVDENLFFDKDNPNIIYCRPSTGKGIFKGVYSGQNVEVSDWNTLFTSNWTMIMSAAEISQSIADFAAANANKYSLPFEKEKYGDRCALDTVEGKYFTIVCRRSYQDTYAWIAVLDIGNGLPISSGGDAKVIALAPYFTLASARWCVHHATTQVTGQTVFNSTNQVPKNAYEFGDNTFSSTLTSSMPATSADTDITVSSGYNSAWGAAPSWWQAGDPVSSKVDHALKPTQVGDVFKIDNEFVRIISKTSPTQFKVKRGVMQSQVADHSSGATFLATCATFPSVKNSVEAQNMMPTWRYLDDPYGEDVTGTYVWANSYGGHMTARGNRIVNNNSFAISSSPNILHDVVNPTYIGGVAQGQYFAGKHSEAEGLTYQTHPTYHQINAPAAEKEWWIDARPFIGGGLTSVNHTKISGLNNVYQYNPAYFDWYDGPNSKHHGIFGIAGRIPLTNISGPGSVIDDSKQYTYCIAVKAGECRPNSQAGQMFVSAPTVNYAYCSGGETYSGGNDLCLSDTSAGGNGVVQYGFTANNEGKPASSNIGYGFGYSRMLSSLTWAYRNMSTFVNAKALPNGKWIYTQIIADNGIMEVALIKSPPFSNAKDALNRYTFIPSNISITPPSGQGITNAVVYFGYHENSAPGNYYCTTRNEACAAVSFSVNESDPFKFAQVESYTGVPCTTSCTVTVPVLPSHVAYYQVKYLNSSGQVVGSGDSGVIAETAMASASGAVVSSPTTPIVPTQPPVVDTKGPLISSVNASNITQTGATINWTTDEPADSQIEYGLTTAYGASSAVDNTLTTSHTLTFNNLTPGTTYNYRVKSKDVYANATNSFNYSFSTLAPTQQTQTQTETTTLSQSYKDWLFRKVITLNKSKIQGSHTNFPLLISLTDPDLKSTSGGGKVASTQGADLVFTTSDDTKLSHEIEKYDPTTGQLIAWVKVPSISSATDTTLNLYFGNSGVGDQQDKTNVWDSNYRFVYHLGDGDSTSANFYQDSTSNNIDATLWDGDSDSTQDTGKIGYGYNFAGDADYMTLDDTTDPTAYTVSAWVKYSVAAPVNIFTRTDSSGPTSAWSHQMSIDANTRPVNYAYDQNASVSRCSRSPNATSQNTWYYITTTAQNGSGKGIYVDGALKATSPLDALWTGGDRYRIAQNTGVLESNPGAGCPNATAPGYFGGVIDELRLSLVVRSTDWIATEYNNQNDPALFVSVGATQSVTTVNSTLPPAIKETAGPSINNGSPSVTFSNTPSVIYSSSGGGGGSTSITSGIKTNTTNTTTGSNLTSVGGGISLPRDLVSGAKGSDVVTLQNALINMGYLSTGNNTGFYGPLTLAAVRKYQQEKGLGGPGDRGWGNVGPKTRALLANSKPLTTTNTLTPAQKAAIQAQINSLLTLVSKLMVQLQALQGR